MSQSYDILYLRSDSPEVIEQLGSKRKFWFRLEGDDQPWLFKYTRENTGEDWSEKIASEIAHLLKIPAARVELAMFMGKRGCASRSFALTKQGVDLVHGSEIMAGWVYGYEKSKQWGQSEHCIRNIIEAVEQIFPLQRKRVEQLRILASYIVLDALICNTDRHHDNWGLLRRVEHGLTVHTVAPSFDHASSLGRELQADRRAMLLSRPNGVRDYVRRGRGGIFWDSADKKGENPLLLAVKAAKTVPRYFTPCLDTLRGIDVKEFFSIVERIPLVWMPEDAKEFCCKLLAVSLQELREVLV